MILYTRMTGGVGGVIFGLLMVWGQRQILALSERRPGFLRIIHMIKNVLQRVQNAFLALFAYLHV